MTKVAAGRNAIRFGLIGAGGIGAFHRRTIEALEAAGRARLIAIADPTDARLTSENAAVESRGVRWHLDYRDMLRDESELDAVVIATPIPFHQTMAAACIERGVFVHLEKPPVPMVGQLEELIALDSKFRVNVGFQLICARCTQEVKRLIVEGALGAISAIRVAACWPRTDSYYNRAIWAGRMRLGSSPVFDGPATNALSHLIHTIMYFAADGRDEFAVPVEVTGELYRARGIESYDTACLRGVFASGLRFACAVTHAAEEFFPFAIEVHGTKGWARLSDDGASLETSLGTSLRHAETTPQLFEANYENFTEVIAGRAARFSTRLADTRGYVATTNAMFLASGGIRDISERWVRRYERNGDGGFDVAGLRAAVEESLRTGKLFSEQGLPWAQAATRRVCLPLDPQDAAAVASMIQHAEAPIGAA
jgi:predicted dehydrogenase